MAGVMGSSRIRFFGRASSNHFSRSTRRFRFAFELACFWATSTRDARTWLEPLAGMLDDLSVSSDPYHGNADGAGQAGIARDAAAELGIPCDYICVAEPEAPDVTGTAGVLPPGESAVLYRGRAAKLLAPGVATTPWEEFTECPWEALRNPERLHVDPLGYLHICQGIVIGNVLERSLAGIMAEYDADRHPIVGPLLAGGPAQLVREHGLTHEPGYADHCHLCYEARCALRGRFPDELAPDQMYGDWLDTERV